MHNFVYERANSADNAMDLGHRDGAAILAGGTELLNWMRIGIESPDLLVDIRDLGHLDRIEEIEGGLRIGALCRLNDVACHPAIKRDFPVLSSAILQSASAQLRNLATIGGNPLQRVRCPYFREETVNACNKRHAGSGCAAYEGHNERMAIFGWTPECVAVQPSDPAVAFAALDAVVIVQSTDGTRRIPMREFHVLPDEDPSAHSVLGRGELITGIEISTPAPHSAYLKVRERQSYEYALVSAAVTLDLDGETIRNARIALGSVAMRPWRLLATEDLLVGKRLGSKDIAEAVDAGFAEARALSGNAYKITLARNAALRAIELASEN
ncbi:xanthine dehydrogenase family protein subunit M [Oceanicella sp. SM1341]|uniref:FAD binding domain-containing protein n=1 Tax=Oceanicella sp. SM1341 TaxID=1548889 RepID=UPI000E476275|nr:xanthine dehydrogenase family protein subunit M [Oceanicella sp. SM1341]